MKIRVAAAAALALSLGAPLHAQGAAPAVDRTRLHVAPSGRARTEITLMMPVAEGQPAVTPLKVWIDYGQPHARGRSIVGGLVPFDSIWRTGANSSTTFSTDADLTIGGVFVPKGMYSLYTLPTRAGWKLIINRQTGQWGTTYDATRDLGRVDLAARTLSEPAESFTITLVPADDPAASTTPAHGRLVLSWGTTELSTDWKVGR